MDLQDPTRRSDFQRVAPTTRSLGQVVKRSGAISIKISTLEDEVRMWLVSNMRRLIITPVSAHSTSECATIIGRMCIFSVRDLGLKAFGNFENCVSTLSNWSIWMVLQNPSLDKTQKFERTITKNEKYVSHPYQTFDQNSFKYVSYLNTITK